ncbi:ATP-dependent DNA helicase RecQ [Actinokineospora spheciospongiae]|nr:ATP-dependent DNA helicase RecQ [Actinokineospora spheciospongiae]
MCQCGGRWYPAAVTGQREHLDLLRRTAEAEFGWTSLTGEQLTAMAAVMGGEDVLVVLPTGAGKSAVYQVPALLLPGVTVVVSPLIALQQDQIEGLDAGSAAVAVNSARSAKENREAWRAVRDGTVRYLFLAPEQLSKEDVLDELAGSEVALFVVDEAHCVSAWGHDFRPDYLRLHQAVERLGHPTTVALTATAAPPVRDDIVDRLHMRRPRLVVAGFDRPNLHLTVHTHTDDTERRTAVVHRVRELAADAASRPGLLYTASRRDCEGHRDDLAAAGVRVAAYHAGMRKADREQVHRDFLAGDLDVVVATSAFGMGIDKPDVRFVVHAAAPESLDSYYQQIGRAGRDGDPATVELFYRAEDMALQRFLTGSRVPEDTIAEVVSAVRSHGGHLTRAEFTEEVSAAPARRTRALNHLDQAGVLDVSPSGDLDYRDPEVGPGRAIELATEAAEGHRRMVGSRLHMMRAYAETTGCRRQHLLGYFGEVLDHPCGACDTCAAGTASTLTREAAGFAVQQEVRHAEWGAGTVMSVADDRVTVLFEEQGYRTLSLAAVQENDLLTPVG